MLARRCLRGDTSAWTAKAIRVESGDMSVQARTMAIAIADIFEALTAKDRPYKDAKPLSEALQILAKFSLNGHIDPDLFHVHPREGLPALRPCFSECGTK